MTTTFMTWFSSTHKIPLSPEKWSIYPCLKPDLSGCWGILPDHTRLHESYATPSSYNGPIQASDVLVPIEVQFPAKRLPKPSSQIPIMERTIPPGLALSSDPSPKTSIPFIHLSALNEGGSPVSDNGKPSIPYDTKTPAPSGSKGTPANVADVFLSGEQAGTSSNTRRTRAKRTSDFMKGLDFDKSPPSIRSKLHQMGRYMTAIREAQPFRNAAVGIILNYYHFSVVYADTAATIYTTPIHIFSKPQEFISTILFLIMADYPALGFDTLWVPPTRVPFSIHNPIPAANADPRNIVNRIVYIPGYLEPRVLINLLARRHGLHARCTTVFEVHRPPKYEEEDSVQIPPDSTLPLSSEERDKILEAADLPEVFKICFQPLHREGEPVIMAGGAKTARLLHVEASNISVLEFWTHPALKLYQPVNLRRRHIICLTPRCRPFSTVTQNDLLLKYFLQTLKGNRASIIQMQFDHS